jgi:hypothetical protein
MRFPVFFVKHIPISLQIGDALHFDCVQSLILCRASVLAARDDHWGENSTAKTFGLSLFRWLTSGAPRYRRRAGTRRFRGQFRHNIAA